MKGFWVVAVASSAAATFFAAGCGERSLEMVEAAIRRRFPEVPVITTTELAARLEAGEKPVLLDVRTPEEFAVSHLPGARRVDPGASTVSDLPLSADIVTYCSVGYRSAAVAEKLRQSGYRVRNLEGAIFAWANEGRPVYRDGKPVLEVHPYDPVWGRLLDERRRRASGPPET